MVKLMKGVTRILRKLCGLMDQATGSAYGTLLLFLPLQYLQLEGLMGGGRSCTS
jgi:hypothetical protein